MHYRIHDWLNPHIWNCGSGEPAMELEQPDFGICGMSETNPT